MGNTRVHEHPVGGRWVRGRCKLPYELVVEVLHLVQLALGAMGEVAEAGFPRWQDTPVVASIAILPGKVHWVIPRVERKERRADVRKCVLRKIATPGLVRRLRCHTAIVRSCTDSHHVKPNTKLRPGEICPCDAPKIREESRIRHTPESVCHLGVRSGE